MKSRARAREASMRVGAEKVHNTIQEQRLRALHCVPGVYFIGSEKAVKIGHSANPGRRISQLQTASDSNLRLLHTISEPDRDAREQLEQDLHRHFSDLRITGEWFGGDGPYIMATSLCYWVCDPLLGRPVSGPSPTWPPFILSWLEGQAEAARPALPRACP